MRAAVSRYYDAAAQRREIFLMLPPLHRGKRRLMPPRQWGKCRRSRKLLGRLLRHITTESYELRRPRA